MAMPICIKRMSRERKDLEMPNADYFVKFNDDNLLELDAYIYGAPDSQYRLKLIKVHINIPTDYPFKPPMVKFIQHGRGRVHPNLYADGKVCLSILGTWPGDPWVQAMNIEKVLITIRSLLDKQPFKHEPGQNDDPRYNQWVQYATWKLLLLDYVEKERDTVMKTFLNWYLDKHGLAIVSAFREQMYQERPSTLSNRYDRNADVKVDHPTLVKQLIKRIEQAKVDITKHQQTPRHATDITTTLERLRNGEALEVASAPIQLSQEQLAKMSRITLCVNLSDLTTAKRKAGAVRDVAQAADAGPQKKLKAETEVVDLT